MPNTSSDKLSEAPPEALRHWLAAQQTLASSVNLALVTVGADNRISNEVANETSICQSFLNDPVQSQMCAEFCGRARERALAEGHPITYRCRANLHCFAAPINVSGEKFPLVVIGGRTFLSIGEYRKFLQQEINHGRQSSPQLFTNLKFTEKEEFQRAQQRILNTAQEIFNYNFDVLPDSSSELITDKPAESILLSENLPERNQERSEKIDRESSLSESESIESIGEAEAPSSVSSSAILSSEDQENLFSGSFEQSCRMATRLLGSRFQMRSSVLLMRNGRALSACAAGGEMREFLIDFSLSEDSPLLAHLQSLANKTAPFSLKEAELAEIQNRVLCSWADVFPYFIGEELTGVLIVLDTDFNEVTKHEVAQLWQRLVVPLELSRLRSKLNDQTRSLAQSQDFAHLLATRTNALETYSAIVEKVATALNAERVSLLIYNEESKKLICKAAIGLPNDVVSGPKIGEGICGAVIERGEPLIVRHVQEQPWIAARAHRNARTDSFISFPLLGAGKRLGVINLTDRADGGEFTIADLEWLKIFSPYAAAALEKIDLYEKAQRFQMLAITDPLTGLLNRRYLEERFTQEIERSKRYQFPLSFVMLDIDGFKAFNDTFGHQAGDDVLRETAQCIRTSLRNFDVAARYGGEEFIVVLPETDVTSATILAERLRKAVEQHFAGQQSRRLITVSIGVSSLSKILQNRHQVIRAADQALYAAKKRGKNCVVVYNTQLVPGLT